MPTNFQSFLGACVFAKTESVYNAGPALLFISLSGPTSDAIRFAGKHPIFTLAYAFDGKRDAPPGTAGQLMQNRPSGRHTSFKLDVEGQGIGAAYTSSATTIPNQLAVFLVAAGESGSWASGSAGGPSTWTFAPTPSPYTSQSSAALLAFSEGASYYVNGIVATYKITGKDGGPSIFEFDCQGTVPNVPVNAILPTGNIYPPTYGVFIPKNENIQLSINGVTTFKVRDYSFDKKQTIQARVDLNSAGGHAGFALNRRAPMLTVKVEATPFSTFDPNTQFASGSVFTASLTVGNQIGNTFEIYSQNAQIRNQTVAEDGPIAVWTLEMALVTSQPGNDDDYQMIWT